MEYGFVAAHDNYLGDPKEQKQIAPTKDAHFRSGAHFDSGSLMIFRGES